MGCCFSGSVQAVGDLPNGVVLIQRSSGEAQALGELLTRAFAGSADTAPELGFDWCFGPEFEDRSNPMRTKKLGWIFRYVVEEAFASGPKGAVLACRKPDGSIGAVAVLKIFRGSPKVGLCEQMAARCNTGMPNGDAEKYLGCPRMKAMLAALKKLHATYASGSHLYVWTVAVDPSAQGQGFGGKLMRAASAVADREKLPCYLECCGEKNPAIYGKYGYKVVGEEKVRAKGAKGAEEEEFKHPYLGMVRPRS